MSTLVRASLSALDLADPLLPFAESNSQRVEACNLKNTGLSPLDYNITVPHFPATLPLPQNTHQFLPHHKPHQDPRYA
jgi:hypothetical protein